MEDWEHFGLYASLPLSRRNECISVSEFGFTTWRELYRELSNKTKRGKELLRKLNEKRILIKT
jgi:hypothetical protein